MDDEKVNEIVVPSEMRNDHVDYITNNEPEVPEDQPVGDDIKMKSDEDPILEEMGEIDPDNVEEQTEQTDPFTCKKYEDVKLNQDEIEFIDKYRLRSKNIFRRYWYGVVLYYNSAKFLFEKKIYKTFLIDWIYWYVVEALFWTSLVIANTLGNSFRAGVEEWNFRVIGTMVIGGIFAAIFLFCLVLRIVLSIVRIDSLRRIRYYTIKKIDKVDTGIDEKIKWIWWPKTTKPCRRFQRKIRWIDFLEGLVLTLVLIPSLFLFPPIGTLIVISVFSSLTSFRVVFVNEGMKYRNIYNFWRKHFWTSLGAGITSFIVFFIPVLGAIAIPTHCCSGVRLYFHHLHIEKYAEKIEDMEEEYQEEEEFGGNVELELEDIDREETEPTVN